MRITRGLARGMVDQECRLSRDPDGEARSAQDAVHIGLQLRPLADVYAAVGEVGERACDRDVRECQPVFDQEAAWRELALEIVEQSRQLFRFCLRSERQITGT